jgi:hypothetical protein
VPHCVAFLYYLLTSFAVLQVFDFKNKISACWSTISEINQYSKRKQSFRFYFSFDETCLEREREISWALQMAPSFDSAVSSLLCAEDNSIFDDTDYGTVEEVLEDTWLHRNHRNHGQDRSFGGGNGLPLQSDECLALMVEKECQHLPAADYLKRLRSGDLDLGARRQTVDWIGKVGLWHFLMSF